MNTSIAQAPVQGMSATELSRLAALYNQVRQTRRSGLVNTSSVAAATPVAEARRAVALRTNEERRSSSVVFLNGFSPLAAHTANGLLSTSDAELARQMDMTPTWALCLKSTDGGVGDDARVVAMWGNPPQALRRHLLGATVRQLRALGVRMQASSSRHARSA